MILWRYILRAHLGPFLFSNVIIVFLFLLQFLMKRAGDLVGKGLGGLVITELIALNLAWILVLSIPMSVLVATLMAFGSLSQNNEITIMRGAGMSLYRMMTPVMFAAIVLTLFLVRFNNDILPEANIRLRTLMSDIIRIKPTLSLRAGVFTTESELPNYRILVRKTFEKSNDLEGITIYDLSQPGKHIVLTAEYGVISFTPDYTCLIMDLRNGEIHETRDDDFTAYRRIRFTRHRIVMPAEGFGFERSDATKAYRDDRTMSAAMMNALVDSIRQEQQRKKDRLKNRVMNEFAGVFHGDPVFFSALPAQVRTDGVYPGYELRRRRDRAKRSPRRIAPAPAALPDSVLRYQALLRAAEDVRVMQSMIRSDSAAIAFDQQQMDKYNVEIYKKYSIPFACIVFVLVGIPLGMMARRGGFGVGASLSLGFFLIYWACLIGGEKLADRDLVSPLIGMWIANIIFGVFGVFLTIRFARETRVIDWHALRRKLPRRFRPREEAPINPYEA